MNFIKKNGINNLITNLAMFIVHIKEHMWNIEENPTIKN